MVGFAAGEAASCFAQTPAVWGCVRICPALLQVNWNSSRGAGKVCGKHDSREGGHVRSRVISPAVQGMAALAATPFIPAEVWLGYTTGFSLLTTCLSASTKTSLAMQHQQACVLHKAEDFD